MVKQGDIIKINFDPQIGHEQAGYRPAVILSNDFAITHHNNIAYACPITNTVKPYPSHILLDSRTQTTGVVLCEQGKALDLNNRQYVFVEELPDDLLVKIIDTVKALIDL